jgi:hypothetical protein
MAGNIFQIRQINMQQTINSNRFSIRFIGLNNKLLIKAKNSTLPGVQTRYEAVKAALGDDPATSLELSLFSSNIPKIALEIENLAHFNDSVKSVTKFTPIEAFNMVFYDYVNGSASAIMSLWHSFVGDKRTGAIGFKQDFVLPKAYFYVYGPDAPGYTDDYADQKGIPWLQKYEIINLFPADIDLGEHSQETANVRKVTCAMQCDNIYPVGIRIYNYNAENVDERYSDIPVQAL